MSLPHLRTLLGAALCWAPVLMAAGAQRRRSGRPLCLRNRPRRSPHGEPCGEPSAEPPIAFSSAPSAPFVRHRHRRDPLLVLALARARHAAGSERPTEARHRQVGATDQTPLELPHHRPDHHQLRSPAERRQRHREPDRQRRRAHGRSRNPGRPDDLRPAQQRHDRQRPGALSRSERTRAGDLGPLRR